MVNPSQFTINKSYNFSPVPIIGQTMPNLCFSNGNASTFHFSVIFHKDAGDGYDFNEIFKFFKGLNKVNENNEVAKIEFWMGEFKFCGNISHYSLTPSQFDEKCIPTIVSLDVEMISTGEFENDG